METTQRHINLVLIFLQAELLLETNQRHIDTNSARVVSELSLETTQRHINLIFVFYMLSCCSCCQVVAGDNSETNGHK